MASLEWQACGEAGRASSRTEQEKGHSLLSGLAGDATGSEGLNSRGGRCWEQPSSKGGAALEEVTGRMLQPKLVKQRSLEITSKELIPLRVTGLDEVTP